MRKMPRFVVQISKLIFSGALLTSVMARAEAALIDFDSFADGTSITTQYQSLGAVFSSNGGGPAHIFVDPAEARSQPNILVGNDNFADLFVRFVDPVTGLASAVNNVSVYAISVGHAQWTVTARNLLGQALETFELQRLNGPVNGLGNQELLAFTSADIASIDFVFTISNPGDGIGIDDLSFNTRPVASIPEPGALGLLGAGLAGLIGLGTLRRRQNARSGRKFARE